MRLDLPVVAMKPCLLIALVCFFTSCAVYKPAPLEPGKAVQQFERRSLSNPPLCDYLKTNLGVNVSSCQPQEWDLAALTLLGFYYSPDLAVAEARVAQARAAIVTASARPNPTLSAGPEYSTRRTW